MTVPQIRDLRCVRRTLPGVALAWHDGREPDRRGLPRGECEIDSEEQAVTTISKDECVSQYFCR